LNLCFLSQIGLKPTLIVSYFGTSVEFELDTDMMFVDSGNFMCVGRRTDRVNTGLVKINVGQIVQKLKNAFASKG